jgi:flagellar assembly protein FliH
MSERFSTSRRPGVLLFDEDFDQPPPSDEPEVIQPVFTLAEILAARDEAARESRDEALAEADASARAAAQLALTAIAAQVAAARSEVTSIAEQSSEAIARLLLGCFATAFPALSARHGTDELTAVIRAILPALHREPKITVRINPHHVTALTEEFRTFDTDLAARVRLLATDAVALGDARITWENGAATRDTTSLWQQIENVLASTGLVDATITEQPAAPAKIESTAKEHELVE